MSDGKPEVDTYKPTPMTKPEGAEELAPLAPEEARGQCIAIFKKAKKAKKEGGRSINAGERIDILSDDAPEGYHLGGFLHVKAALRDPGSPLSKAIAAGELEIERLTPPKELERHFNRRRRWKA